MIFFRNELTYSLYKQAMLKPLPLKLNSGETGHVVDMCVCLDPKANTAVVICEQEIAKNPDFAQYFSNVQNDLLGLGYPTVVGYYADKTEFASIYEDHRQSSGVSQNSSPDTEERRNFNELILKAYRAHASDIHFYINPDASGRIVFDIHDRPVLIETKTKSYIDALINAALSSSGEGYAGTNSEFELVNDTINWRLLDESGKFFGEVKLRLNKVKTTSGTHTVIRLGRTHEATKSLAELGIADDNIAIMNMLSKLSSGIFILTGPTGTGKSTTLDSFYETIPEDRKIVLLGDPIESVFKRNNIVPISINAQKEGYGYIEYIQSALRQAPKVIGIAEARSAEVMKLVFEIALTGHLIATTYHAEDSFSALMRMHNDGIPPHLLGSGLLRAVGSQRLLRRLCDHCKIPVDSPDFGDVYQANKHGCDHCDKGVSGRLNVSEILYLDSFINDCLLKKDIAAARDHATKNGFRSMAVRAQELIVAGLVDPDDALAAVPGLIAPAEYIYASAKAVGE